MTSTVENYGMGTTGVSYGILPGTLERHAVPLPWRPRQVAALAICGRTAFLTWVFGLPLAYSLSDGSLCEACASMFRTGRR